MLNIITNKNDNFKNVAEFHNEIESEDFSNYSINDKMEYYKEKATYLNTLLVNIYYK
jgi:hypothetical protein